MRLSVNRNALLIITAATLGLGAILAAVPGSPLQRFFLSSVRGEEVALAAPEDAAPGPAPTRAPRSVRIITVLPKDAIPAIMDPEFVTGDEAEDQMSPTERVLGLSINGDHRAYSVPALSSHEVVNDVVGGVPVAVTW